MAPNKNGGTPDPIATIQQQIDQLGVTAGHLDDLADAAHFSGDNATAITLQNDATAAVIRQNELYKVMEQLDVTSAAWQSFVSGMTNVNNEIKQALANLATIVNVVNAAAQLLTLADALLKV
jgi:diketogulonate reductase-like aldo/keto reductase